jgi:hypothetical protein
MKRAEKKIKTQSSTIVNEEGDGIRLAKKILTSIRTATKPIKTKSITQHQNSFQLPIISGRPSHRFCTDISEVRVEEKDEEKGATLKSVEKKKKLLRHRKKYKNA